MPELSATSIPSPAENVTVPPREIAVELAPSVNVIVELDNLAFAIEPANSSLEIPESLIVTAPDETAKLSLENDALPFTEVDASAIAFSTVPIDRLPEPSVIIACPD
mgnify:CR=1 FL=1